MAVDVVESELRMRADQAVNSMKSLETATAGFATQLKDVLKYLDDINKKSLGNINKQINNVTQNRNIASQSVGTQYDFGSAPHAAKNSNGSVMTSATGRDKLFRDYQQAIIDETNEIKKDIEERKRLRQRNSDTARISAEARKTREDKREDKSTAAYSERMNKIADAKLLNAKAKQAGALNSNWRYQIGRGVTQVGDKLSTMGTGGRIGGDLLSVVGKSIISPASAAGLAIAKLGEGVLDFAKAATTAYAEIESIKTQLGVVFSSQSQADSMFGELSAYAVKSPFGVQQTSELAILLKQSGVYASDLMDTLRMIGDTAGGNMEKMKRIANNYAQIVSIGKASMLDMRQFAYAGIPIFEAVGKELGVAQSKLREMISDGKITSDIIEKVFKDLTGVNGIFENATEIGAKTLKARLQNLSDAKQLALSGYGERLVNAGSRIGNDSVVYRIVSAVEGIFSHLYKDVNTTNIENSVKNIENRKNKEYNIADLIEYNKKIGNKDMVKALESLLKDTKNRSDIDKDRASYVALYDSKNKEWNDYVLNGETRTSLNEFNSDINKLNGMLDDYALMSEDLLHYSFGDVYRMLAQDMKTITVEEMVSFYNKTEEQRRIIMEALRNEIDETEKRSDALALTYETKEVERRANIERNTQLAQQYSGEGTEKYAKKSDSLMADFQELASIFEKSQEEQTRLEEERIKRLKAAQEDLRTIAKNTDKDTGVVDITKFSVEDFVEYRRRGAFNKARDLTVVDGKNLNNLASDRQSLTKGLSWITEYIEDNIKTNNSWSTTSDTVDFYMKPLLNAKNDKEFLKNYAGVVTGLKNWMQNLKKLNPASAELYDRITEAIDATMYSVSTNTTGISADVNSAGNIFIPLWKRILAEYTGLTTEQMLSTKGTLDNFRNNMSVRNTAKSTGMAILNNGGYETFARILGTYEGMMKLKSDDTVTKQIDWAEAKTSLHDFATQLSASSAVISAYTAGLESELDAYNNIVTSGLTQAESQGLKSQRTISASNLAKIMLDGGNQLVNAFDVAFKTDDDKEVFLHEDGKWYDSMKSGNEVQVKELQVTSNLYDWLKQNLPSLFDKLTTASVAKQNNLSLEKKLSNAKQGTVSTMLMRNNTLADASAYALTNPDYASNVFSSLLRNEKQLTDQDGRYRYGKYAEMSENDILIEALKGDEQAVMLLNEVIRQLGDTIYKFINTPKFKAVDFADRSNGRNESLNKWASRYNGTDENSKAVKPSNYGGWRGAAARISEAAGVSLDFDIRDRLYKAATTSGMGLDSSRVRELQAAELNARNDAEKKGASPLEIDLAGQKGVFDELAAGEKAMLQMKIAGEELKQTFSDLGKSVTGAFANFAGDAISSSFETWGEALMTGADASDAIGENLRQLGSSLLKNLGSMITQAGLALAISSVGNLPMVMAGLGIAAAGGGLSMLGGMLGASEEDESEEDDKYEKLLRIKEDLSDLLKQAREDAIYYENTVRHKNALSMNESIGSRTSVNDAIIKPDGRIITTHPDDYLIATKTPQTLFGGSAGTPTVNFSVIDKSTGIKVASQKARYNEDTNSIDFEAVIESKISEFIASSKGDDAFAARESRVRGMSYIA